MRLIAEGVGIVAGVLAIATYLGINVRQYLKDKRQQQENRRQQEENKP